MVNNEPISLNNTVFINLPRLFKKSQISFTSCATDRPTVIEVERRNGN